MSSDFTFTKENLDNCLRELGKEFRKLNGTAMKAEITLISGAAILANYGFRDSTFVWTRNRPRNIAAYMELTCQTDNLPKIIRLATV